MSVVFREGSERTLLSSVDVGLLSVRDRACMRLLYRAGLATADQLATFIFPKPPNCPPPAPTPLAARPP